MATNVKALRAAPVLGFEWSECYYRGGRGEEKLYIKRNLLKAGGCIPILNVVTGIIWIIGAIISDNASKGQRAGFIIRGVVSVLGGGIPFLLADIVMTAARAAFRKERAAVEAK